LVWTESELAELQSSPLRGIITSTREQLRQGFERLTANLNTIQHPFPAGFWTFERYFWSYLAVTSHLWNFNGEAAMVPLADLLQHDPAAGVGAANQEGTHFVINSTSNYEKGVKASASLGAKSNLELLKAYGYVLENNPSDSMSVIFNLKATTLAQGIVEPLLRKVDPNYQQLGMAKNIRPDRLLRVFRLSTLTFAELEHLNDALEGKPVSLENELKAYRSILNAIQSLLKQYSTTVEQDAQLLQSTTLSVNVRNAIILRKGEKEILLNNLLVIAKLWENILLEGTLPLGVPVR